MEKYFSGSIDEFNFLKTGQELPDFTWLDESGNSFSSLILSGKPVLIILFTTSCRHCRNNFNYLEQNLFSKNVNLLNVLAFGRDCDHEQVKTYRKDYSTNIKMIADPNGEIYSKFAEKAVPRNYMFDSEGRMIAFTRGFRPVEIDKLIRTIFPV